MRGHRVATMAKYKGDKAKKEFEVDNSIELNRIRDKYTEQLTTEDDKKILPAFFGFISKQKGYYDPQHKAYLQHDTSMDYLQMIVSRFKTKNKLAKPTSKLIDLFDMNNYHSWRVNHKQISHIMKYVTEYMSNVKNLFNNRAWLDDTNHSQEINKYEEYQILQERLVSEINNYRIGYSTMIFIIMQLEEKRYYKYRNVLLPLLLTACRDSFLDAIIISQDEIDVLVEGGNDIFLFDYHYEIQKNSNFLRKIDQNVAEKK